MKHTLTILLLLFCSNLLAQRIKFSPPEKNYPGQAAFEIIGKVSGHYLTYLEGQQGAELGIFDEEMNKIKSAPVNFLKTKAIHKDFFAYSDHFQLFFQYNIGSTFYITRLKGDGDGDAIDDGTVMDSVVTKMEMVSIGNGNSSTTKTPSIAPSLLFPRMFMVLRSENKQWFMILKAAEQPSKEQRLEATLYDNELRPKEHSLITFSKDQGYGEFSEFILDNDGDLAFTYSNIETGGKRQISKAAIFYKRHGADTLVSTELSFPGTTLDQLTIREDNINHRYILNSLYHGSRQQNLIGLSSLIWDKRSMSLTSSTLTPLSIELLNEARSDFSPPEQILNYYYLRHVFPYADGGFLVLAELCYGNEKYSNYTVGINRFDFIRGMPTSFTPWALPVNNSINGQPGQWRATSRDRFGSHGAFGIGRNTDNLLVFIMDREGKARSIKVIHKSGYTTPGMEPISYQAFNDGKAIHLIYNENIKGHWHPAGTSIKADGTLEPEPLLHSLDRDQVLFPRFGKQMDAKTAIIPCQVSGHLSFARTEF